LSDAHDHAGRIARLVDAIYCADYQYPNAPACPAHDFTARLAAAMDRLTRPGSALTTARLLEAIEAAARRTLTEHEKRLNAEF
jgi:hypothetical protein